MKKYIFITLIGLISLVSEAQTQDATGKLGFTVNFSINGELLLFRATPSVTYTKGKNQLELGVGMHPFNLKQERLLSFELNHKYYPNGQSNKYNMYFISRAMFVNNKRKTFYPTTYNYLFMNAGYGFDVIPIPNYGFYMGTNMTVGAFSYSKQSDTPHEIFEHQSMFKKFGYNFAFQANLGYRF